MNLGTINVHSFNYGHVFIKAVTVPTDQNGILDYGPDNTQVGPYVHTVSHL